MQAQLQHSGVAQVIEASIEDKSGEPYAVVEHVEGRSLGDLRARAIQVGHAFGWAESIAIATLIAEALGHVHERLDASGRALAIVHRDLSPQNVMVSYAGECKIHRLRDGAWSEPPLPHRLGRRLREAWLRGPRGRER